MSASGRKTGGARFWRGALYRILRNRVYLGEIAHRDKAYPGEHQAIVPKDLWELVQAVLDANVQGKRNGVKAADPSLLAGLIYDDRGNRMTPCHTRRRAKRYRYYVSQAVIQGQAARAGAQRIPAHDIETIILHEIGQLLTSSKQVVDGLEQQEDNAAATHKALVQTAKHQAAALLKSPAAEIRAFLLATVQRITVREDAVEILISKPLLRSALLGTKPIASSRPRGNGSDPEDTLRLTAPAHLRRRSGELRLILAGTAQDELPARLDPALIKAIARGFRWYEKLVSGKACSVQALAAEARLNKRYVARVVQSALLAPDIIEKILGGRQPPELTLSRLFSHVPLSWAEQRQLFGLSSH